MKTLVLIVMLLCTAAAFGQYGVSSVNNQAQPIQMADHPQHADRHDMRGEQSLVGGGSYTSDHGDRPLWEFGHPKPEVSLGEYARALRKESGKKTILDKQ